MTLYMILTILIALVGVVSGVASLIRTRKVEAKQLEFQSIAAALAARQLETPQEQESARSKADVMVELQKVGPSDFRFILTNQGAALATAVAFRIAEGSPDNPLLQRECTRKLPYPKLEPGQSFSLIAALTTQSAMSYRTQITWQNVDRSGGARDAHVSV